MDDEECFKCLLLAVFCTLAVDAVEVIQREEESTLNAHIREQRRLCRSLPAEKTRPTWMGFWNRVSDSHFRRQFRMTRHAFTHLCNVLCTAVGVETFRPENMVLPATSNSASNESRGGLIPGEVKVAIALRLLSGGSYLDLMPLFDVSNPHIYVIFDDFLDWVLSAFHFPLAGFLEREDWGALAALAEPFSYASNGSFNGIIGALDGLAIRIRCPWESEVPDPGNYFCRKGFFALNVQAICDRFKKFLWCYPSNKGSTHDSVAFTNSRLYSLLTDKADLLEQQGYYIVGDSAYNLTPFLLTPYSTDEVRHDPTNTYDTFNFFLSSSRIFIECAFGELVRRWGILWKPLSYDLAKSQRVIQVCMLLHNHIKDHDATDNADTDFDDQQQHRHDGNAFPLVSDNNETNYGGRRGTAHDQHRLRGDGVRRSIALHLQLQGLRRPLYSGMQYNQFGHVYFE